MSDNKNTDKVQGFFVTLLTTSNTYVGLGAGLVLGFILSRFVR
jgi:hypothetical protein